MVLLRPSEPGFMLVPGRYMLVYKNQAYDFSVAGAITDTAQCLEQTENRRMARYIRSAANCLDRALLSVAPTLFRSDEIGRGSIFLF